MRQSRHTVGEFLSWDNEQARVSNITLRVLLQSQPADADLAETVISLFTPVGKLTPGFTTVALAIVAEDDMAGSFANSELDSDLTTLFTDDEQYMAATSDRLRLPMHVVEASPAYRAAGIEWEIAFQVGLALYAKHTVGFPAWEVPPDQYREWHKGLREVVQRLREITGRTLVDAAASVTP